MRRFFKLDWVLTAAVVLLLILGLLALYSLSLTGSDFDRANFGKQIAYAVFGLALMLALSLYDYRALNFYSTKLYFAAVIILTAVIFWGTTIRGTTGWIGIFSYHIQPVEITKLILIVFLASFLSKKKTQLSPNIRIISSLALVFIPIFLILKQPDLGSASIILGFWIILICCSGLNKKNFFILTSAIAICSVSGWFFLKDYQKERLVNFVEPYKNPTGSGYNVIQSMVAVGSGKLTGKGLGHGSQSQLNFLPEKHTDFIFAVIAEEFGFLGASSALFLFGIIFWRIKEIARLAHDNFGHLLTVGVMAMFFLQVLINVGMNVGIMPVAGVPLPFLSYGGSSIVSSLIAVGLIQSVYTRGLEKID